MDGRGNVNDLQCDLLPDARLCERALIDLEQFHSKHSHHCNFLPICDLLGLYK